MDTHNKQLDDLEYLQKANDGLTESLAELTHLNSIIRHILATTEKQEIEQLFIETVKKLLPVESAFYYAYDDASKSFITPEDEPSILPNADLLTWLLNEKKVSTFPIDDQTIITAYPLHAAQTLIGLLCINTTEISESLDAHKLELISHLADNASVSFYNEQLKTKQRKHFNFVNNIVDSITNGIIAINSQNIITLLNRNAMAIFEIAPDEAIDRPLSDVLPENVMTVTNQMLQSTRDMGFAMEQQVTHQLSEGQNIDIALSTSLLRDEMLMPIGVTLIFRDMTASRELDRLRKLDQLKSEFVANVSHELKTPLTSIKAYTEALLDMVEDEQVVSFLQVVDEESDRLLFLISDLLNISKIESGKLKLSMSLVKPKDLIDEVLKISKVQSETHEIIINYDEALPHTLLDKDRMKEVMINLMSNAIKYSPDGGKVIVTMSKSEQNLKIDVKDSGIGISKENADHVFDQFYRVDSSITASIGGTGLGLAIVKNIVETHGGVISCESVLGEGTTFTVILPIKSDSPEDDIMSRAFAQ